VTETTEHGTPYSFIAAQRALLLVERMVGVRRTGLAARHGHPRGR